jgi:hypothetical protein
MSGIQEMVAVGEVRSNRVRYIAERKRRGGEFDFDVVDTDVERVAMLLPITADMAGDGPAVTAYVQARALPLFQNALGGFVARRIEDSGAERRRVRPLETNERAIRRCARRVERRTQLAVGTARTRGDQAVVGAFGQAAQLWLQGTPAVDVGESVGDEFFARPLTAIRVQQQAAVSVYRPEAFAVVRLRTWPHRLRAWLRRAPRRAADALRPARLASA